MSREDFKLQMDAAKGLLFGNGASSIEFFFTVYSPLVNHWVYAEVGFNYGIEDQVNLDKVKFRPFRPDPYDMAQGQTLFKMDVARCCLNFLLNLINICIIIYEIGSEGGGFRWRRG
jgi:hypothetical protein